MTTILIVDDEATIVDLLQLVLEDAGYRVVAAANGREALTMLATERPALILTDYMMPGLDGVGLAQAIQADPVLAGIPVVIMSAVRLPQGHDGLWVAELPKPWQMEQVLQTVATLTGGRATP